jgi:ribokinase
MFDVVVVGSLNLDLVAGMDRLPGPGETVSGNSYHEYPGGKGLNQAVAAARAGASVAIVGAVGDDTAGEFLRQIVVSEGIDDSWLATAPDTATGRALITVDRHAENSIVVIPGANATVRIDTGALPDGRVMLGQLEIPLPEVAAAFEHARRVGMTTVLNPAPALGELDALLDACDVVIPNEHEVELLGGSAALRSRGVGTVVVTRGGEGVNVIDETGEFRHDAFPVTPVDTTGAGDSFCGALATRLAEGLDVRAAITFAAAAGALTTTSAGAVPSLPSRAAIEQLVASRAA